MSDLGSQGGIKVEPDAAPSDGGNYGEPSRPDTNATSVVQPPALPTFPGNPNKAK